MSPRLGVRHKLLAIALLPLALLLPLSAVLLWWGNAAFDRLLIGKVQADLAVAESFVERMADTLNAGTGAVADSAALQTALAQGEPTALVQLLQGAKARAGMDFINLRAADGSLRVTDSGSLRGTAVEQGATDLRFAPEGRDGASLELLHPAQLALLAPALKQRAVVPLLDTANAAPTDRTREERAMVLIARHAIRAPDGSLLGHVQAGVMLNRNLAFIDRINDIVYGEPFFGSEGTATVFIDDVRISTNVRLFGGTAGDRAIGTRVSQAVRDAVLGEGRTWLDRAFVVNDWYVSAYRPLRNAAGERIGMLYVGFLDRPFALVKRAALATIGLLFAGVAALAAFVSLRWAGQIFRPLEQMAGTMAQVQAGEPQARVGPVKSTDEVGQLAGHLDRLLDRVADDTRALQRWNTELDAKVAARTQELEGAKTQLVRSEKLAAIGLLTASMAHEINNPIAVIQGNLDLVRALLPPDAADAVRAELRLIDEQIERMRLIVTQLLQFARPGEYAGYVQSVAPDEVAEAGLKLVAHRLAKEAIRVERRYASTRSAAVNRGELEQVVVNLLVNAIQAMPAGGTLTVGTQAMGEGGVAITVADTGPGLPPDVLPSLFQPFETHKKDGTGLGLWISRSIVERYGGDIEAGNRTDGVSGAVFTVRLQAEAAVGAFVPAGAQEGGA